MRQVIAKYWHRLLTALQPITKSWPVWPLALALGIVSASAALAFWALVRALQTRFYGTASDSGMFAHQVSELSPLLVLATPAIGGALVGMITLWIIRTNSVHAIAEVVEAAALHKGHIDARAGIGSALASMITLSTGGSSGREGPVVHIAAALASVTSRATGAAAISARDLLGCAVAAAVSASFNAPLAGLLFAYEVVLRHYALHVFGPLALAAVTGAVLSRLTHGDVPEFALTGLALNFYEELPAFFILGILCGLVASAFMHGLIQASRWFNHIQPSGSLPVIARPALAGFALGGLALLVPEIVGVGYETTSAALSGTLTLWAAIVILVFKFIAVIVTLAGKMGGGVFTPALMIGALLGLSFGIVATSIFPENSGDETLYALAGMGAVAAAVLGAPLSTALIVFEMTGDWQAGIAVLVALGPAVTLSKRLAGRSVFDMQLSERGIHLAQGPQQWALRLARASDIMQPVELSDTAAEAVSDLRPDSSLAEVLAWFENSEANFAIVRDEKDNSLHRITYLHALRTYTQLLSRINAEHHD